ncbi:hypothetical protein BDZ45DRAFT_727094 [Acephala macrosclerotiorum]|nr:hypothetical protein BDZ45DRAFT_727094 [Acephala macrosclerotiorum]
MTLRDNSRNQITSPIHFFGDGSLCLHPSYQRVLQSRKDNSLLSTFLARARLALQYEITKIPVPDRKGMPDLAELEALIQEAPAILVIIQLGQFISYYEARPEEPYPSSEVAITVGLCVGQLSAIAVSQARSLVELIPLAVESVRIAFRTSVTATEIRNELEQQSSPSETWAMTVPTEIGNELETIHETAALERKKAYVSASFRKAVTVQGPPTTLVNIDNWLSSNRPKTFRQHLPIYTPYHAPHLYSQENISKIVDGSKNIYSATKSTSCAQYVAATGESDWAIKAFGPTPSAGSLASSLKIETKVEATIDDFVNLNNQDKMATPAREPIAIVGMMI